MKWRAFSVKLKFLVGRLIWILCAPISRNTHHALLSKVGHTGNVVPRAFFILSCHFILAQPVHGIKDWKNGIHKHLDWAKCSTGELWKSRCWTHVWSELRWVSIIGIYNGYYLPTLSIYLYNLWRFPIFYYRYSRGWVVVSYSSKKVDPKI